MISRRYHKPGEPAPVVFTGDIILHMGEGRLSKLIKWAQSWSRTVPGKYAGWSHASLVSWGPNADITEALEHGVELEDLSKYDDSHYCVIRTSTGLDPVDLEQIIRFAATVRRAHGSGHGGYGYAQIFSLLWALASGSRFRFGLAETMICSGFVCSALTRAGYIWPEEPGHMTPAGIAWYFDAPPPEVG